MIIEKPDIVTTLEREGIEVKRTGANYKARCPFHEEKTASFFIFPRNQRYYCFGCHEKGDVIDFIVKYRKTTFREALNYLGIRDDKPTKETLESIRRKEENKQYIDAYERWKKVFHCRLCSLYTTIQKVKMQINTIEMAEKYAILYHKESWIEFILDLLENNNEKLVLEVYHEWLKESA